ncbi:MAG: hypothetical protein MJB14_10680 [Spirochaetes bacterium]|nr:hypothetical protein [Spirochaetota bacterium]
MKKIWILLIIAGLVTNGFSLQIAVDELKTDKKIEFVNYEGSYTYRETVLAIRSIGRRLARGLVQNNPYRYLLKYSVIHALDNTEDERYNADIISIDEDARVEHIRNVRQIIAGYLEQSYGYSRSDANTLAFFITIYNAVYRGQVDYYSSHYKPIVTQHIDSENAGLSTKYYDWPGKTKMIIPLTDDPSKGKITSLDTSEISDQGVIDQLRQQEDLGLKERQELVELKEKEVAEQKKEIAEDQQKLLEKQREITKQEKDITDKEQQIIEKEQEITEQKDQVEDITDPVEKEQKEQEIAEKEEQLQKEKEELEEQKEELITQKEETQTQKDEVAQKEQQIEQKEQEIASDKREIAKDEFAQKVDEDPEKAKEELIEKEEELAQREEELKNQATDDNILGVNLYYLKIKEYLTGGKYNNDMFIINAVTRKIKLKSSVDNISGRKYDVFGEGVVVITQDEASPDTYYLTLLDKDKLEVKALGELNIFWRSFVEIYKNHVYAIVKDGESYYLGKFDANLGTVAQSSEEVSNDTFISFFEDVVYINSSDNRILVLKQSDLSLDEVISP